METKSFNKDKKTAPFAKDGDLLSCAGYGAVFVDVTMPFDATLRCVGHRRGRSSIVFYWKDIENNKEYPMFVSDFCDGFINHETIKTNEVCGTWQVVKKGMNYGIKLVALQHNKGIK